MVLLCSEPTNVKSAGISFAELVTVTAAHAGLRRIDRSIVLFIDARQSRAGT